MTSLENFLASAPPAFLRAVADVLDANAAESPDFRMGLVKGFLLASTGPVSSVVATEPAKRTRRKREYPPVGELPPPSWTASDRQEFITKSEASRALGLSFRQLETQERHGRLAAFRNEDNPHDRRVYYPRATIAAAIDRWKARQEQPSPLDAA